ncbi:MAG: hypothetical protein JO150_15290 [Acidobacteriaceae bacterium]|nr:hypothetical protein [Acidobacteriaceae bacterium]
MKISFESELMKNQKHAVVMAPDKKFAVLQSVEGDSLFFSIGELGELYLTREGSHLRAGWDKISLIEALKSQHNGAGEVRTFEVSQNAETGNIDLALAFTVNGADLLYISLGHSNSDFAWARGVEWTNIPFDGPASQLPVLIADIYLLQLPTPVEAADAGCFVVDLKKGSSPLGFYDRYYITPSAPQKWNTHMLATDFAVKQSCLGRSAKGLVRPGIYTLGTDANGSVLQFRALRGFRDQAPTVARLAVPSGATAIAAAMNSDGNTNLFVAGDKAIYLFLPDNLHDNAPGQSIVQNDMLTGVQSLYAETGYASTTVWGLNAAGDLFRLECKAGSETIPSAWSYPIPLFRNVQKMAPFLNRKLNRSVIFGYMQDEKLVQMTQDPVSAQWRQRNILLPPTAVKDMVEYTSFTTNIKVTDDNTVPIPNSKVAITATTRVGVYLNDVFQVLSDVPLNVSTDTTGSLTIVQETQTLSAVVYHVKAESAASDINPMDKVMGKVGEVNGGSDLEHLQVTNPDGTKHYLLPTDTPDRANTAKVTAQSLQEFAEAGKTLPPNSTAKRDASNSSGGGRVRIWGVSYNDGSCQFHKGDAAVARFGANFKSPGASTDPSLWVSDESAFVLFWEDAWNWFMGILHKVEEWFVHAAKDVWHFFVKIGETLYKVVVDCISAVVRAVQFVFHKIKVFFEDLIKWLGFIFEWQDILRTHRVAKHILLLYAKYAVDGVGNLETDIAGVFDGLEARIAEWAHISPGPPVTVGNYQASSSTVKGHDSPGSNWALHHAKSNLSNAISKLSDNPVMLRSSGNTASSGGDIFSQLETLIGSAIGEFKTAIQRIKTDIIDPMSTLSVTEIIIRLSGIVGDLLLGIAKDLIVGMLKIAKELIGDLIGILTADLQIPILSPIYSWLTETKENPKGDALTFLDLGCLIASIPATIIFKLIKEQAPFPDNALTKSLIDAPDLATLRKIFTSGVPSAEGDQAILSPMQIMSSVGNFFALYGAITVAFFSALKYTWSTAETPIPSDVYGAAIASSLPYIMPNIVAGFAPGWDTRWPIMNDTVTAVWLVKTGADNIPRIDSNQTWSNWISPIVECVINACWLVPAIGGAIDAKHMASSDWVGLSANGSFDVSGILVPFTKNNVVGAEAAPVMFVIHEVLTVGYGLLSAVAGGLIAGGK